MTTDNLIERVGMALARHHFPPWSLEAAAKAAIAAVQEWQPIETAFENGVLQTGQPFLAVKRPFDPQVVHIEGDRVVRFNDDGSVREVKAERWTWLPRPGEPPSEE